MSINARAFYGEYHGHTVDHLTTLYNALVAINGPPSATHHFVFLCGDSSFDSKYWKLGQHVHASNGYEQILRPANSCVPDVCTQLNAVFAASNNGNGGHRFTCINCAVEESTVGDRDGGILLPQDKFLRDHVTEFDIVACSLGGNDIALKPSAKTVLSMGWLAKCSSTKNVQDGSAWGLGHFKNLLGTQLDQYFMNLLCKKKPMMLIPCMIYFLDENPKAESWANTTLGIIGYNDNPQHVQALINRVFAENYPQKRFPGVRATVPVQLSKALDGKDTKDYVARVEPSAQGAAKMARLLAGTIQETMQKLDKGEAVSADSAAPAASKAVKSNKKKKLCEDGEEDE